MVDVNVSISGIVLYCDDGLLPLSIGHGYAFEKVYLDDLPFKDKIVDRRDNLNITYMGSRLHDEKGTYFICIKKQDSFQIAGFQITERTRIITDTDMLCEDQLTPYQNRETDYLYRVFALLRLFKTGNIGTKEVFYNYRYDMGIVSNNVNHTSDSITRNIVDTRQYKLTPSERVSFEQFWVDYSRCEYALLKAPIDEFLWGLEQVDEATGFEQYTSALEMVLVEKNEQGKKQVLSNRVAMLLGNTSAEIGQFHTQMLVFYRYRSESLHEGDGSNITQTELYVLEEIVRSVIKKTLIRCKAELTRQPTLSWEDIKRTQIMDLKAAVNTAQSAGILPRK